MQCLINILYSYILIVLTCMMVNLRKQISNGSCTHSIPRSITKLWYAIPYFPLNQTPCFIIIQYIDIKIG